MAIIKTTTKNENKVRNLSYFCSFYSNIIFLYIFYRVGEVNIFFLKTDLNKKNSGKTCITLIVQNIKINLYKYK